jgi:CBS domain-containing protein
MVKVSEVMSRSIVSTSPREAIQMAAKKMKEADVGCLPVVEGGSLQGVITDRDIVVCAVAEGRDPSRVMVEECETHNVFSVDQDADIEEAARVMRDKQVRRVPVTRGNQLVGMVSLADLARRQELHDISKQVLAHVSQPMVGARR